MNHRFGLTAVVVILASFQHECHGFLIPASSRHHHHQQYDFHRLFASSSSEDKYDLIVVGAGVAGVQAALIASQAPYHKKVLVVDAPFASGKLMVNDEDLSIGAPTGLFSKALRDTSKKVNVPALRGIGLREESVWNEIISSCVDLAQSNAQDIRRQLAFANVDLMEGLATFPDGGATDSLLVTRDSVMQTIRADKILLCTGSQPFRPSGIPFDGKRIFDSDSINAISYLPRSVAITGSGIIAVEFAKIFRNLGAEVTLIIRDNVPRNALQKIGLDKDVAATLVADLIRSGIRFERGAQVKSFDIPESAKAPIKITLEASRGSPELGHGRATEIKCDAYLAAVGRKPNTGSLNLAAAGIKVDEYGGILVGPSLATTATSGNVFAAGDVLGRPFLASTGVAQGKAAVASMFGDAVSSPQCRADDETCNDDGVSAAGVSFDPASLAANPFAFPTGVWSSPEVSQYGLTLQHALEMNIPAGESIALYAECLRGRVFSPDGLLKLVYNKENGRIIGVHICGDDACELIHYGMELVKGQTTINTLTSSMFSAVTYHEMYRIAAQAALDEAGARKRRAAAGKALAERHRKQRAKDN
ncbi:hypothetical protein MPSEU_000760300 [Mayamaea pseudoterrestris]|nr:hypothetical protein MPSEU_000760300 [Mayamaea pseudoterrestris]